MLPKRSILLKSWFLSCTVWLVGCGFHLRGVSPEGLPPIYLEGGAFNAGVRFSLERILRASGGPLVQARDQAKVVVHLTGEDYQRRPLSISRQLLVQEYDLYYIVSFQVTDLIGNALAPPQSLTFTRDYTFASTAQALGKGNEEGILREEMVNEAVRQILSQILTVIERFPDTSQNVSLK